MSKKDTVKKAIEAIQSNDAVTLRKSIKEALVHKVRKALEKKEKQVAKTFLDDLENK